jgi:Tfp pilus assembly protein PilO
MKNLPKPTLWIVLAALSWAGGAAAFLSQYGAYGEQVKEQHKLAALVQSPQEVEKVREQTAKEVAEAQKKLEHLEKGVPEFAYVPTLLKELEAFGGKHGIEVFGVRPMPARSNPNDKDKLKKTKQYIELSIEIKGRGKFENLLEFVEGLKTFPKIVAARAVSLTPRVDPQSPSFDLTNLDIMVELKTYVFPPSERDAEAFKAALQGANAPADQPVGPANRKDAANPDKLNQPGPTGN